MVKPLLFRIGALAIGLMAALLPAEIVLQFLPVREAARMLPVNDRNPVIRFQNDRDLVWSRDPGFSIVTRKHLNNHGFFHDRDYAREDTTPLLAVIGDSYVAALQVPNRKTFYGLLDASVGDAGRVSSFASSGSPLSNYLAYAVYAAREFGPDGLVITIVGNDFDESLARYQKRPGSHAYELHDDSLRLIRRDHTPSQLMYALSYSALVRYLFYHLEIGRESFRRPVHRGVDDDTPAYVGNTLAAADEERLSLSRRAIDQFLKDLPQYTGLPADRILLVIDGVRPQLYDPNELPRVHNAFFTLMREHLMKVAEALGYDFIDLQPLFVEQHRLDGTHFEYESDSHWNPAAHRLIAKHISASMLFNTLFPIDPAP